MEKEKKKKKRSERHAAREGASTLAAQPTEAAHEDEPTVANREEMLPTVPREEGAVSDITLEIVAQESTNIECDIVEALTDSECITGDQGGNFENIMAMDDLSIDRVENMPMMEINSNRLNSNIQETALTEVAVIAPSAPAIEENCAFPNLIELAETIRNIEEIPQMVSAISEETSGVYDDLHPLSEDNLVALYKNTELPLWKEYSSVVTDTRLVTSNNPLVNEKIGNLSRLRDLIEADRNTLEEQKKILSRQMDNVWSFEKRKVMETGECQDGNPVTAELDYIVSHFDAEAHAGVAKSLSFIKEICYENMVSNLHLAELEKDFLERHIETICRRCIMIDSPSILLEDFEQEKLYVDITEIRTCIALLMKFLRQKKQEDLFSQFIMDLLVKLVSIFLRAATWKDHMFMLRCVLGTPNRIPDWMIRFVQVPLQLEYLPESPFTSRYLHHLVCVLDVLMSPIEHRRSSYEFYLPGLPNTSNARTADEQDGRLDESTWMIVDSDGEEDETAFSGQINSNDIIELFNQVPLQDMYAFILKLKKGEFGKYVIDTVEYNDRYMLDLFAFCTVLVRLYEKGLHTYGKQTYQQFAKRLGQLINHTVQHVTDVFDSYRAAHDSKVELWLQCEFDMFVIRAVNAIYSSKDLGMWQFLATLPYHQISSSASWKIFYILHIEYDSNIEKKMPRNQCEWIEINQQAPMIEALEDRLCTLPESDAIYLLSALSSLAMPIHESSQLCKQFFETLTTTLFKIGFLSDVTQDKFSKHIKTLLASITSYNPWLISSILHNMRAYNFLESQRSCLDLFLNLPLAQWVPIADDLAIIRCWLCDFPVPSVEFCLARLILNGLNYNTLESDTENDLVLTHNIHCSIALMIVEASVKFSDAPGQSPRTSTSTLKDVISMMCRTGGGNTVAQKWAWGVLLRLRIHSLDRGKMIPSQTISSPEIYLQTIPDLFGCSDLQMISNGVLARQPMACFVAIAMTTWGHSVPLICTKGFPLILDVLMRNELYLESIACISLLVPMFVFCPESLIACDVFHSIVVALCSSDRGSLRIMGTNVFTPDFPGPILHHMGSMIETLLRRASCQVQGYGKNTLDPLITLWLKCLIKVPDWINNQSVLYLMDIILRRAFFYWDRRTSANSILDQELVPSSLALETKEHMNTTDKPTGPEILSWLKDIGSTYRSLMSRISLPNTAWFATFVLLSEKNWQEVQGIWNIVRMEMYSMQPGQVNVPNAVKLAISMLKIPTIIPASNLAIYRWGQQALDTPMDHPLLPYIWHVFFMLYLGRLPSNHPNVVGSVGYKFFESAIGQQTIKKMKKQLLDTANLYNLRLGQLRSTMHITDTDELYKVPDEIERLTKLCRLFKTYHLWMEDHRLMGNVILSALTPMYDIPRLTAVFNNDDLPGRLMVSESVLGDIQDKHVLDWMRALKRPEVPNTIKVYGGASGNQADQCVDKITKRLKAYNEPLALSIPEFKLRHQANIGEDLHLTMLPFVNDTMEVLRNCAQAYSNSLAEHTAAVCSIQDILPLVYSNVQCEKVLTAMCHSSPPHRGTNYHSRESTCAGQAEMRVVVTESQANDIYVKGLDKCQKDWEDSIVSALKLPTVDTCKALLALQGLVNQLVNDPSRENPLWAPRYELKGGVVLLFHLISKYTEELAFFPPTRQVMHQCMTSLAQAFLKFGHYAKQFLLALLEDMRLVSVLSVHFHPVEASTAQFIQMYGIMADKAYIEQDYKSFYMILSKFDVPGWLESNRTTLADRSALIEEIAKAISAAGLHPDEKKEMLHTAFRKDLMSMLLYKFPENFGNILNHLLRASANQRVSLDVWYDLINSIMQNEKVCLGIEMPKLRDEIRQFANEQNSLPYHEILQTSELLANYFLVERKQFGLYGLYPKYRPYIEPLMAFQALIGHLLTVSWLAYEEGQLSSKICCRLWQSLESMYSPWIAPVWTEQLDEPVAPWIEQLTEDRSVMLPWIPPDKQHASRAVMMFVEGVRFIMDSVSVEVLSHLWEFYVTKFARNSVPDYVLSVVHNHFENLPWQQFRPNCLDVDRMYKIVTQSVPSEVHGFLGTIFVNVAWLPWLSYTLTAYKKNKSYQAQVHMYLLHLHVKMAREKEVRKKSKVTEMLSIAKKFEWHLVDATAYGQVVDWWVFRFDPRVAAGLSEPYINPIDKSVMSLLEAAAGFSTEAQPLHPTTPYKRVFYVRGVLKMLIKCTSEDKAIIEKNLNDVSGVVYSMLSSIENIIQRTVIEENRLAECTLLVKEVVVVFNQPESSELKKLALRICTSWLQRENCMSYVVKGLLGVLGTDITNPAIMGLLLETCFTTYFKNTVVQESTPSWSAVAQLVSPPMVPNIEDTLLSSGYFLTLHALLFKQIAATKSVRDELTLLTNLVEWICQVKPSELVESKLPLLWGIALLLVHRQCELSESLVSVTRSVRRLISHFNDMSEEKGQFLSLLGTLGLRKNQVLSLKGRLLCRAMAVFLLAQLPEGSQDQITLRTSANSPGAILDYKSSAEVGSTLNATADAVRALRDLEALVGLKSHAEMKDTVELAIKLIKDPNQTINTAKEVLGALTAELYTEQYLHILTASN